MQRKRGGNPNKNQLKSDIQMEELKKQTSKLENGKIQKHDR